MKLRDLPKKNSDPVLDLREGTYHPQRIRWPHVPAVPTEIDLHR